MEDPASGPELGDAFGLALRDMLAGAVGPVVIERDDGFVDVDGFDYLNDWLDRDRWALDRAGGRVLDVGAGAGRGSLALQDRGQGAVALDVSPGAIEVCRKRGVREVFLGSVPQAVVAGMAAGAFDSILMLGNNISLVGSPAAAVPFLAALGNLLGPGGVIVCTGLDPLATSQPAHLAYHQRNRRRGRPPGQVTIRVRYKRIAGEWFDWLIMSPPELADIAARAGWKISDIFPGTLYAAVLTRA